MPLEIYIKTDTLIRIIVTYKKLNKPIRVKSQNINSSKRKWFMVVEWGEREIS